MQIGNWKSQPNKYSVSGLLSVLNQAVDKVLSGCPEPGVLLSGGVDSSILAVLTKGKGARYFTIGSSFSHPDIVAAIDLAKHLDLSLRVFVPSSAEVDSVRVSHNFTLPGDECVYIALDFASHFVTDILATDGIDEQMGGYWWHTNKSDRFANLDDTFRHFWGVLEPNHLCPMFESAKDVGLSVYWVYLFPEVVDYISRIPLEERVSQGVGKYVWRELGKHLGLPDRILSRPKLGFVDALSVKV